MQDLNQIRAVITASANSFHNVVGTNIMGQVGDKTPVVDLKARVIGVNDLRVVDALAFPFLPPGQPQSIVCKYLFTNSCNSLLLTL